MINIATRGKFAACCDRLGGGAPPYSPYEQERVKPTILVRNVEIKTINDSNKLTEKIRVKLIEQEE